jgi:hypothetical protein
MIRVRSALCTIAVASLALVACKKEGGEVTKETGAALTFLPKDTKIVFGVNLGKLASASILESYKAEMLKNAPPQFSEMQAACGIDIFKDFSSIVVGMVDDHRAVAVVSGNFTKDKVESCIKTVAEKEGKTFEAKDDGKLRVYTGAGDTIYAHWLGDGSVAMTSDDAGGAALLNEILGGAKLGDGDVMTMVKSTKTSAGIWAAGKIDASMTGGLPVGGDVSGFAVTVNASDTLDIKAMASFADADKASQAASQARMALGFVETQPKLAPFVSIIKKLKIESDGKALKVGVSLDSGDLEKLKQIPNMM